MTTTSELTKSELNLLKRIEKKRSTIAYWQEKSNPEIFQSLVEKGMLNVSYGHNCIVTETGMLALGFDRCDGEAHSNPYIDHCGACMPRWGWRMPQKK